MLVNDLTASFFFMVDDSNEFLLANVYLIIGIKKRCKWLTVVV